MSARNAARISIALLLLCACGPKAAAPVAPAPEAATVAAGTNPAPIQRLSADDANFCQMRQQGPDDLVAFLSAVEACDGVSDPHQRQQARCDRLGADETRLRANYPGNPLVMHALDQARSRPWPQCPPLIAPPATEPDPAEVEAAKEMADAAAADAAGPDGEAPPAPAEPAQ